MPLTHYPTSTMSLGGSASYDPTSQEIELEAFQKKVAEELNVLSSVGPDELLSISWVGNLLNVFISCQEEFRLLLSNNLGYLFRSPMDRFINEFYERSVKALDVCNAIRDGIEQVRNWERLLEIVLCALDKQTILGEAQFRRAKKALIDLLIGMLDEKESNAALAQRNRSFGRSSGSSKDARSLCRRSLSWSVSRSWSASRQLQTMANNVSAPRVNEVMATNGLAVAVYTMNCVLFIVMWALVAAIPCQDRGFQTHISVPRHFVWAASYSSIYDRIIEDSKKREKKNACGLLKEVCMIEKWTRQMNQLLDSLQFPLSYEKEADVRDKVEELKQVFGILKDGSQSLERQIREVFHRIVRSRTDGLDSLGRNGNRE